jgi:hypothetical protein
LSRGVLEATSAMPLFRVKSSRQKPRQEKPSMKSALEHCETATGYWADKQYPQAITELRSDCSRNSTQTMRSPISLSVNCSTRKPKTAAVARIGKPLRRPFSSRSLGTAIGGIPDSRVAFVCPLKFVGSQNLVFKIGSMVFCVLTFRLITVAKSSEFAYFMMEDGSFSENGDLLGSWVNPIERPKWAINHFPSENQPCTLQI